MVVGILILIGKSFDSFSCLSLDRPRTFLGISEQHLRVHEFWRETPKWPLHFRRWKSEHCYDNRHIKRKMGLSSSTIKNAKPRVSSSSIGAIEVLWIRRPFDICIAFWNLLQRLLYFAITWDFCFKLVVCLSSVYFAKQTTCGTSHKWLVVIKSVRLECLAKIRRRLSIQNSQIYVSL